LLWETRKLLSRPDRARTERGRDEVADEADEVGLYDWRRSSLRAASVCGLCAIGASSACHDWYRLFFSSWLLVERMKPGTSAE
jgi:hypothetical protein